MTRWTVFRLVGAGCGWIVPLVLLAGGCGSRPDGMDDFIERTADALSFGSGEGTFIEGEGLALPSSAGKVSTEASASGGRALFIWSNAVASVTQATNAVSVVRVRARGDQCNGPPHFLLRIDGVAALSAYVPATAWTYYESGSLALAAGTHRIDVEYDNNNVAASCDRNLRVDRIELVSNPFAKARFYVDPASKAKQQADAWRTTRPADAAQMDKLAQSSWSRWLGDWSGDIAAAARREVDTILAAGALPVLVAYNIPHRDCAAQSSAGAPSADAYRSWIRGMNDGIAGRRAVVVLEPDAVACADVSNTERYALLRDAVNVLSQSGNVAVYVDAGHSGWIAPQVMAARLQSAGVAAARGFSLNVSNFRPTADEAAYGAAVVSALGVGKRFLIDTSRNGLGYNGQWCNPAGRALGARATAVTAIAGADAFYWIKTPGLSDGTCNGGPAAGTWWPEYALGLAQRAAY